MISVTSRFTAESTDQNPNQINLKFTFSNSLDDQRILGFSNIRRTSNQLTAGRFKIDLANTAINSPSGGSDYNHIHLDKSHLNRVSTYGISFTDSGGTESENLSLFTGRLLDARYTGTKVSLTFGDKFDILKDRVVGASNSGNAVQFINSEWNPADLFWTVVTSYGELSNIQSTSNPDIDYTTFLAWQSDMDIVNVLIQAEFTGENVLEAIRKIAEITNTTIVTEGDGKIHSFSNLPTIVDSPDIFNSDDFFDLEVSLSTNKILNDGVVQFGYDVNSNTFTGSFSSVDSTSINTFGRHSKELADTAVWHSNKLSAQFFIDHEIINNATPQRSLRFRTGLSSLKYQLSDRVVINDIITGIINTNNRPLYRLTDIDVNAAEGIFVLNAQESVGNNFFFLDSTSPGPGLGLLDQDYNPLF